MLGDKETQRAWMLYAEAQDIPHDHEDEDVFKQGFVAGRSETAQLRTALAASEAKVKVAKQHIVKAMDYIETTGDTDILYELAAALSEIDKKAE